MANYKGLSKMIDAHGSYNLVGIKVTGQAAECGIQDDTLWLCEILVKPLLYQF